MRLDSDAMMHFDMLRFVAAAGIVWHHSHEFFVPVAQRAGLATRTQALALFVDLFFVISGFVITFVYDVRLTDGSSYRRFLQRRVGRLVPLHWLTLALSYVLWTAVGMLGLAAENAPDLSARCVLQTALLLNGLVSCGNGLVLNGVTWSISAEMALYLLFPLMLFLANRRMLIPAAILALLVALATARGGRWDQLHPLMRALPSFLFGMLLFRFRTALPVLQSSIPVCAMVVITIALMMTGVAELVVLACVYLLATIAVATDRSRSAPRGIRMAARLGQLTYGIYMWHLFFIIVLMNALGDKYLKLQGLAMASLALVCYVAIFAWSVLSLGIFETPARRWIDRL